MIRRGGERAALAALARSHGIQLEYTDAFGKRRRATREALLATLRALGEPIERAADAAAALRAREEAEARRMLPPVVVHRSGTSGVVDVRVPAAAAQADACVAVELEDGGELVLDDRGDGEGRVRPDRQRSELRVRALRTPRDVPPGYHGLRVEVGGRAASARLVAAPQRVWTPPDDPREDSRAPRRWGAFLPLHALRTARDWGAGDLGDLAALARWIGGLGGDVVGVLPLLAGFLDEPFDPSPYAPVSRVYFGEHWADVGAAPEVAASAGARALLASDELRRELARLRDLDAVDYRAVADLKRRVLDLLAAAFFERGGERRAALEERLARDPDLETYARFRAAMERHRTSWRSWPSGEREGRIQGGAFDEAARRRHLYAQLLVEEQLAGLRAEADAGRAAALYLDLPIGAHRDGFDVWRHRDAFAEGLSTGAPPDAFFRGGQDWGFPPIHPERSREGGHRVFASAIASHLRFACWLRIDHVMALHRLFVIPRGLDAAQGVYVRQRAEEAYAVLAVESHRARAVIVGEDLGTVPPVVRGGLHRHGVRGMHVVQFEARPEPRSALPQPRPGALAAMNTHDMPTFASFWSARDVDERVATGLLAPAAAQDERRERARLRRAIAAHLRARGAAGGKAGEPDAREALLAILLELARSRAGLVLVGLEDLWLEERPQNVPGVRMDPPSWRRKSRLALAEMQSRRAVSSALEEIDRAARTTGKETNA